jgi:hypothetical protein
LKDFKQRELEEMDRELSKKFATKSKMKKDFLESSVIELG